MSDRKRRRPVDISLSDAAYYCQGCGLAMGRDEHRMCRDADGDLCKAVKRLRKRPTTAEVHAVASRRATALARAIVEEYLHLVGATGGIRDGERGEPPKERP